MLIRRHEAVFLALVAVCTIPFLLQGNQPEMQLAAAASGPPNPDCKSEWVYKDGLKCQEEEKDAQGKPTGKKNGKTCDCKKKDEASGKTVPGKCVASGICHATKTAEGEKPQTCIETGKCKPGQASGDPQQKGGEPKMPELPKPPGGGGEGGGKGGETPKPNGDADKREVTPKPNEDPKPNGWLLRSDAKADDKIGVEKKDDEKDGQQEALVPTADGNTRSLQPTQSDGDRTNVTEAHEEAQASATGFGEDEKEELSQARVHDAEKSLGERLSDTATRAYEGAKEAVTSAYNGVKEALGFGDDKQLERGDGLYGVDKQLEIGPGQYKVEDQRLETGPGEYDVNDKPIAAHMLSQTHYSESIAYEGGADPFEEPELEQAQTETAQKVPQYSATVEPLIEQVDPVDVAKEYAADALENTALELAKDAAAEPLDTLHTYNENEIEQLSPEPKKSFSAHVEEIWIEEQNQTVAEKVAETAAAAYESVSNVVQTTAQKISSFFSKFF